MIKHATIPINTKFLAFAAILASICVLATAQTENNNRGYVVKVGDLAPDFRIKLTDGTEFVLSDNKGKIIMLQFTASWCGVCRKEMPFIEKEIWQTLKDKNFILLGLDKDEPLETVKKFASDTKVTYPLGLDTGGDIFMKYAEPKAGITRNVIINKQGEIVYLTRLFNRTEFDEMKKVIFELVN